jgi:uncharacterized membrane protein YozB (DUF420 family)
MVMDFLTLVATISLSVQIVVLILLALGYSLKGKKMYRQHGMVMLTAVVLHIITILVVMVPSFASFFSAPGSIVFDLIVIVSLVHAALGVIAVILGIWLVASWRLRKDMQMCFAKKKIMLGTLTLWVTAILLGIFMYISFYATRLLG